MKITYFLHLLLCLFWV